MTPWQWPEESRRAREAANYRRICERDRARLEEQRRREAVWECVCFAAGIAFLALTMVIIAAGWGR